MQLVGLAQLLNLLHEAAPVPNAKGAGANGAAAKLFGELLAARQEGGGPLTEVLETSLPEEGAETIPGEVIAAIMAALPQETEDAKGGLLAAFAQLIENGRSQEGKGEAVAQEDTPPWGAMWLRLLGDPGVARDDGGKPGAEPPLPVDGPPAVDWLALLEALGVPFDAAGADGRARADAAEAVAVVAEALAAVVGKAEPGAARDGPPVYGEAAVARLAALLMQAAAGVDRSREAGDSPTKPVGGAVAKPDGAPLPTEIARMLGPVVGTVLERAGLDAAGPVSEATPASDSGQAPPPVDVVPANPGPALVKMAEAVVAAAVPADAGTDGQAATEGRVALEAVVETFAAMADKPSDAPANPASEGANALHVEPAIAPAPSGVVKFAADLLAAAKVPEGQERPVETVEPRRNFWWNVLQPDAQEAEAKERPQRLVQGLAMRFPHELAGELRARVTPGGDPLTSRLAGSDPLTFRLAGGEDTRLAAALQTLAAGAPREAPSEGAWTAGKAVSVLSAANRQGPPGESGADPGQNGHRAQGLPGGAGFWERFTGPQGLGGAGQAAAASRPDPGALAEQALRGVRYVVNQGGDKSFLVRLAPESLGELRVNVTSVNDVIRVHFTAANMAVREALEAQLHTLRDALSRDGLDVNRITVGADPQQGLQQDGSGARQPPRFNLAAQQQGAGGHGAPHGRQDGGDGAPKGLSTASARRWGGLDVRI